MEARFLKSAARQEDYPRSPLPRVAFLGRSNVGKSSLLNSLLRRKGLARTSSTPGRTRMINFFEIDRRWLFVDLPGYGYARAPHRLKAQWGPMIETYLKEDADLRLAVLIVDARHEPARLDQMMAQWLRRFHIPFQVVATKSDKIKAQALAASLQRISQLLEVENVIPYSARTGMGRKELWNAIRKETNHG